MLEYLIDDKCVCAGDRIAVGVSGGADSMLLLWALIDKQKRTGFYLEVINVNHHLRGAEGDADSEFVKDFCIKHKIPFNIVDVDVKSLKNTEKMSVEEAARVARYDAFNKIMASNKLNKLFLAHHKNDQAETILMHIFRGSGILGACGIKNSNTIVRPLLNLKKSEIIKLVKEHGINFVEDSSNNSNNYTRNYIRNVVLPQIEEVYTSVIDGICAFGEKCLEVQNYIESKIDENKLVKNNKKILIKDEVFEQERFFVREYVKKALAMLGLCADVETKHYDMICALYELEVNKQIDLPHGFVARRNYAGVEVFKEPKHSGDLSREEYEFVKNGNINFRNYCTIKTEVVSGNDVEYSDGVIFVDAMKIPNGAVWRTRKIGDIFAKLGTGSKKLNDYFTDKKMDLENREKIPILAYGDTVLVVAGHDVSEKAKIDGHTDEIVKITCQML